MRSQMFYGRSHFFLYFTGPQVPLNQSTSQAAHLGDRFMLWATFCLEFLGFSVHVHPQSAVSSLMLSVNDVSVDSIMAPSHMMIRVTDPFGTGFILHVEHTTDELCPVAAMLSYLATRPPDPGCLFTHLCRGIVFVEN